MFLPGLPGFTSVLNGAMAVLVPQVWATLSLQQVSSAAKPLAFCHSSCTTDRGFPIMGTAQEWEAVSLVLQHLSSP